MKKNTLSFPNSNNNWKNIFLFLIFHWQFLQNGIYCQEVEINYQLCDFSRNTGRRRRRRDLLQNDVNLQSTDEFVFYLAIQLFENFKNSTQEFSCSTDIYATNQIQINTAELMTLRDQTTLKKIQNISEIFVDNQRNLNVIIDYIILNDQTSTEFETKIYGKIDENINIQIQQVCVLQVLKVIVQFESSFDLCSSSGLCNIEVEMEDLNNKFNFSANNEEIIQLNSQFNQLANGLSACDIPNSSCRFGCSKPTPQDTPPQNPIFKYQKDVQQGPEEEEKEAENIDENYSYFDPLFLLQEDYYNGQYYENNTNNSQSQFNFASLKFSDYDGQIYKNNISNNNNNQSQFNFAALQFLEPDTYDGQTDENNNETLIEFLQRDNYDGQYQNQSTYDDLMEGFFFVPIIENFEDEDEDEFLIINGHTQNYDEGSRIQAVQQPNNDNNDNDYGYNKKINLMLLVLSTIISTVAVIFSY